VGDEDVGRGEALDALSKGCCTRDERGELIDSEIKTPRALDGGRGVE
jgi:hypothetical protein